MTARTHDLAAISALSVVFLAQPQHTITLTTLIAAIIANLVGGITPDIDQPTAPFWRNLPIGGFFGRFIDKLLGGHRFITHSLLGLGLIGWGAHWLLVALHPIMPGVDISLVWWAFMIGALSHLVMDSFTKQGVPWLLPIPIKFGFPPLKALRMTTGRGLETFGVFPLILIFDVIFFSAQHDRILQIMHHYLV